MTYDGSTLDLNGGDIQMDLGNIFEVGNMSIRGTLDGLGSAMLIDFDLVQANVKNFEIEHPVKKEPWRLRHSVLEGPEIAVFVRGRITNSKEIILPDYWQGLVREESITVSLTPIGASCSYYVVSATLEKIVIQSDCENFDFYYTVFGERKDIDRLVVEYIRKSDT